jgi:hypothetical protein
MHARAPVMERTAPAHKRAGGDPNNSLAVMLQTYEEIASMRRHLLAARRQRRRPPADELEAAYAAIVAMESDICALINDYIGSAASLCRPHKSAGGARPWARGVLARDMPHSDDELVEARCALLRGLVPAVARAPTHDATCRICLSELAPGSEAAALQAHAGHSAKCVFTRVHGAAAAACFPCMVTYIAHAWRTSHEGPRCPVCRAHFNEEHVVRVVIQ